MVVSIACSAVSVLLLTQPLLFGSSSPSAVQPVFSLDLVTGFPLTVVPREVNGMVEGHYDTFGLIMMVLVPILTAYLVVLLHLTRERAEHWSVVSLWIGVGGLLAMVYCECLTFVS